MNRIDSIFATLGSRKAKALMPFLCGGHPAPGSLPGLLNAVARARRGGTAGSTVPAAPIVEIGIPFSDPIADGPVIAAAMHGALQRGVTPESVFAQVSAFRKSESPALDGWGHGLGIIAMMSYSLAWRLGVSATARLARSSGVDGFIFPDLPVEESEEAVRVCRGEGLTLSLLVAPSTSPSRARKIAGASSGFVYLLARAGITGADSGGGAPAADLDTRVKMLRAETTLPIACGFGIATAEDVRRVVRPASPDGADAAIVGSALVKELDRCAATGGDESACAGTFCERLAAGLG